MKTYSLSDQTIATSITSSSHFIFIHLTQDAFLHIGLTSSSSNCIAFHSLVAINIESSHQVVLTQLNSSFSLTHKTLNQFDLIFLTSFISSFFTVHHFVTKNKYLLLSLLISIIAAISSSFCKEMKFITGCHFAILLVSGIS
jgi:hypothetical protein